MKKIDEYHEYEEIAPGTFRISEMGFVNCYLLTGRQSALLIDTGCGAGCLASCVKQITDKSVICAVTHRHPDHAGGAWQFGSYYADKDDIRPVYDLMCQSAICRKMVHANGGVVSNRPAFFQRTKVFAMKTDQMFDLGGRIITVEKVPGHTKGSVIFLDEAGKLMFTGDDANPDLWMHLPGCTSLCDWQEGAEIIYHHLKEGYTAYYGHGDGRQDLAQVERIMELVRQIILRKKTGCLEEGRHIYPSKEERPNVYYNAKNVLPHRI